MEQKTLESKIEEKQQTINQITEAYVIAMEFFRITVAKFSEQYKNSGDSTNPGHISSISSLLEKINGLIKTKNEIQEQINSLIDASSDTTEQITPAKTFKGTKENLIEFIKTGTAKF